MAGLLRRLRRRPDGTEEGPSEPKSGAESPPSPEAAKAPSGTPPGGERARESSGKPAAASPAPGTPPPPPEAPPPPEPPVEFGPPPPLPPADFESVRASTPPRAGSDRCFLCHTELVGSYCPTCQMTWNE